VVSIKAQYSMEFILIFAFSLLLVIPFISIMNSEYLRDKNNLDEMQAKKILDEIQSASTSVYYSGYPSRTTLTMTFPRGINSIDSNIVNTVNGVKSEIVFSIDHIDTISNIVAVVPFAVNITVSQTEGKKSVLIKTEPSGIINITVPA
jgi:hypothetical protein